MNIVIVGGNERMIYQYKDLCKQYKCKAKVFIEQPTNFKKQIGVPDVIVLFTSTVSHKMVTCALQEARRCNALIARSHSSSTCALKSILECVDCSRRGECPQYYEGISLSRPVS